MNGLHSQLKKASSRWSRGRPSSQNPAGHFIKVSGILLALSLCTYVIVISRLESVRNSAAAAPRSYLRGELVEEPTCRLPVLPVDSPEIMGQLKYVPPIKCIDEKHERDWVFVNGSFAVVTSQAERRGARCEFKDVIREGDNLVTEGPAVSGLKYEFKNSDFVRVTCKAGEKSWSSYLAAPRVTVKVPGKPPKGPKRMPFNVLIWGHDSLSRNMFIRKLPKSYQYLMENLEGIVLNGYNIVGDGTPQALIPILTGKTELELPETRKRKGPAASYVNVYPFVWNQFKDQGYLTGYMEDCPEIGTFTYRLKGFDSAPTDYYMRPFFIAAKRHYDDYMKYCIGSIPRHKIMMDYVRNIMKRNAQVPKFIFSFHSELSHSDMNLIQGADTDLEAFFTQLKQSGALDNTVLLVMSDHGSRFSSVRQSEQGKQEERMPMIMFVFPQIFRKLYPRALKNFQKNAHILSTPFDLHATLLDISRMSRLSDDYFARPHSLSDRSLSLFRPIPTDRTCRDASVEPHWCACLQWRLLKTSLPSVRRAAHEFVDFLNHYVQNQTDSCGSLRLNRVLTAANLSPAHELLRFKQSADLDGFKPDLSDTMTLKKSTLQLMVETMPGKGLFEVSLTHDLQKDAFQFNVDAVSRINAYGNQAACVEHNLEHLRKYCYCDDDDDKKKNQVVELSPAITSP